MFHILRINSKGGYIFSKGNSSQYLLNTEFCFQAEKRKGVTPTTETLNLYPNSQNMAMQ